MITLDYNISSGKNGGKVTAFTYSHSLNELCGSWSAQVAGGTFTAGNSISFANVMMNGIISRAQKDSSGLWHVEGYDAGVKLMRSTPNIEDLPKGDVRTVIQSLATLCGVSIVMSGTGLTGFNVRSLISGSTCAEAILELAMLSGCVAFINSGQLCVQTPASRITPNFEYVIDDSGTDFDLDGYATQATILLRKSSIDDEEATVQPVEYYTGKTPSTSPKHVTYSGTFSNRQGVSGSYSIKMLEPFDVAEREETSITENGITIETVQTHDYDFKHKTIWRDNQEYVLFAFIETGYSLTKTTTGNYSGGISFTEKTTETMTRSLSRFDAVGVPNDWDGQLGLVDTETITRFTARTGAPDPDDNMPAYSPPFDRKITRQYSRELRGKGLLCCETETRYEARQVGTISPVKVDGEAVPHFLMNSKLAIQTHSTPQWVEVNTYRTYYEKYDNDGNIVLSTRSEYCDDGAKWLVEHALSDIGDEELNEYQKAYSKFSQDSQGLEISLGSSVLTSAWHFIELQGRMKNTTGNDENGVALGDTKKWYNNGAYLPLVSCPHYNDSNEPCNVFALADSSKGPICLTNHNNPARWSYCTRAVEALKRAKAIEKKQFDAPIIGTATLSGTSTQSPAVGYKREIFIDGNISDSQAQTIANTIAANILAVKDTKGLRKTVTIPYNPSIAPNGNIVEVSHDWENLTSQVTYRINGTVPDFMIAQSVSGIAAFVSARDTSRLGTPKYGVVSAVSEDFVTVNLGNQTVKCTTKLKELGTGDTVLVSFPSGNKLRGVVISRL